MANLSKVIYINEEDYSTLLNGGTITKGGVTYSHDPTALYVIKNVSAPEYAETAGYATTAGQATKATQDGNGDVISDTYAKKSDAAEAIYLTGTLSNGCWTFEDINGNTLTDAEMIALLEDPNKLISIYYDGFSDGTRTYEATVFRPIGSDSTTFTNFDGDWKRYFYISLDWENGRVYDDEHGMGDSLESRQKEIITLGGTNNAPTFITDWNGDFLTHFVFKTQYLDSSKKDVILKVQTSTDVYHYYQLFKSEKQSSTLTNYRFISFPNTSAVECIELLYNSSNNTFQRGGSSVSLQTLINSGNKLSADYIQDGTNNKVFSAADKTKLDGIEAATASPLMDGTAAVGSSSKYAKEDHVHPSDTSKQDKAINFTEWWTENLGEDFPYTEETARVLTSSEQAALQAAKSYTNWMIIDEGDASYLNFNPSNQMDGYDHTWIGIYDLQGVPTLLLYRLHRITGNKYWVESTYPELITSDHLATVATSGSYNDLSNKPTIPTVNDGTLTIKQNGISRGTFTANQSESSEIDIKSIVYGKQVSGNFRKGTLSGSTWSFLSSNLTLEEGVLYIDVETKKVYYYDGTGLKETYSPNLSPYANVQADWNETDDTSDAYIWNKPTIPDTLKVGSVAGKLYRNNVGGSGNFSISGNSGCIPNLTAGTFLVSIYAKSATQSYTFRFNFGSSVTYDLSTTNGEISDVRQITIPSSGTFSGSVLNSSVASGTILYVVMYDYLTPVSTVGIAAVTNRYADLDGTPNIPTVNNGTLTIQQNGITVGTFTANQSSNTTANIYSTMFGTLGQNGFERDNYNSSTGTWAGVEIVTPNPLVTYVDILSNKLYRYNPLTSGYVELSEGDLSTITSTAITDLTDIL